MTETDLFKAIEAGAGEDERIARATQRPGDRIVRWVAHEDEVYSVYGSLDSPDRCDQHEPGKPNMCEDDPVAQSCDVTDSLLDERALHIARQGPLRALRTAEAIRDIASVARILYEDGGEWAATHGHHILQALASIYQDGEST